ncbi:MAG: FlgD immunoglobulin-like domain containing protein [Thermoleophilia bacterium]
MACAVAALLGGADWAQAADAGDHAPAVAMHTLRIDGGLAVESSIGVPAAGAGVAPAATAVAGTLTGGVSAELGGLLRAGASGTSRVLDVGRRFTMLGLVCDVPSAHDDVVVYVRTSTDGDAWSRWLTVPLEVAAEEGGVPKAFTEPIWTGDARYVQVRAVTAASGEPAAELTGVRLVALDPEVGDEPEAASVSDASPLAATGATPGVLTATVKTPAIISRKKWGADESLRSSAPSYAKVKMIFIHHTAGGNDYTADEAAGVVRAIYAYHTRALGWSDIGYNFLVDRFGRIYEGRYGGVRRGVVGAQVLGFNSGSSGVSMMGNFATEAPTPQALTALEKLLAWKTKIHKLNPRGTTKIRCTVGDRFAAGASVRLPVIAGHRQANYTECPGNVFYPLLASVRLEAAGKAQPPIVSLVSASRLRFSPNGDRSMDDTAVRFALTKVATWRVQVRDALGKVVMSETGKGWTASVTWSGIVNGSAVKDGSYTAIVTASTSRGAAKPRKLKIVVDTVAPKIVSVKTEQTRFSPNGDGQAETATVRFTPAEACSARVAVVDDNGKVVRRLSGWTKSSASSHAQKWDGEIASGRAAPDGDYAFLVECRDVAGNVARHTAKIVLDRTVGFPVVTPEAFSPNGDGVHDTATLGFELARPATVTVTIKAGGKTVRTFRLGALQAGAHTLNWNGKTAAGTALASCRPSLFVTATSTLGTSSVKARVQLDLDPPEVAAPAELSVAAGKTARLTLTVSDARSAPLDVAYSITDATGASVDAASLGVQPAGEVVWKWKPPTAGSYAITYRVVDQAGNAATVVTVLTVTATE